MYVPIYKYKFYVHAFSLTERAAWIISGRSGCTDYVEEMFAAHP